MADTDIGGAVGEVPLEGEDLLPTFSGTNAVGDLEGRAEQKSPVIIHATTSACTVNLTPPASPDPGANILVVHCSEDGEDAATLDDDGTAGLEAVSSAHANAAPAVVSGATAGEVVHDGGELPGGDAQDISGWLARLLTVGRLVVESHNLVAPIEGFLGVPYGSWDEGFRCAFAALDRDCDKFISLDELRALTPMSSVQLDEAKATEILTALDADGDGRVSEDEWQAGMQAATQSLPDASKHLVITAITRGTQSTMSAPLPDGTQCPRGNTEYLMKRVFPLLQQGIAAVLGDMAKEHTKVASKSMWDADGYLPQKYVPMRPLRALGLWLKANDPSPPCVQQKSSDIDWHHGIPWADLTTRLKIDIVFDHHDPDHTEIIEPQAIQQILVNQELDENPTMQREEFRSFMLSVFENVSDELVHEYLDPIVHSYYLAMHDQQQQFRILFKFLYEKVAALEESAADADQGSSNASALEAEAESPASAAQTIPAVDTAVLFALARTLTGLQEAKAVASSLGMSHSASGSVSEGAFVNALSQIFRETAGDTVSTANKLGPLFSHDSFAMLHPAATLSPDYREHVMAHVLYASTPAISAARVHSCMDDTGISEVIGVDCRTEAEFVVSSVLSSMPCDMLQNASCELGWEPDMEALDEVLEMVQESLDMPTAGRPLVVTFCTDGSRGAQVAQRIIDAKPSAVVANLCGGLIAWFNAGFAVEDEDANEVEALHPFLPELEQYITRENQYEEE